MWDRSSKLLAPVLLACILSLGGRYTEASNDDGGDIKMHQEDSCAFFCFLLSKESKSISRHVEAARKLNCTHVVYGYALIDQTQNVHDPNVDDFPMAATWGNYRYLQELQTQEQPTELFLAIRESPRVNFIDTPSARVKVIRNIIDKAEFHYFDGLFLNLRAASFLSFHYENFIRELKIELNSRAAAKSRNPMQLVIAVNGQDAFEAHHKFKVFAELVDRFYLKSDEVISAVDENTAVLVDPLYGDRQTPIEDTISETAERLIDHGVPAEQLVIGLSSWARAYNLVDPNKTMHGDPVYDFVQIDGSMRPDGRFAFQEICELANTTELVYHSKADAVSFILNETQFFSYNPPTHESLDRKLRWISVHGLGGVGVMQLEADDPDNRCGLGAYPLANSISSQFKCSKRHRDHGRTTACNRACIYRPASNKISFENLLPGWCSHIVLSSAGVTLDGLISESVEHKRAVVEYANWPVTRKPLLILSIGAELSSDEWATLISNSSTRRVFVQNARQFYVDNNAHGLEFSAVNAEVSDSSEMEKVTSDFHELVEEVRNELPRKALIFVTATAAWTFADLYNTSSLNRTTDFIILEGHRFHRPDAVFTGHHSPLFSDGTLLSNSNMSIEAMAKVWANSDYPIDRILIGFSSTGMVMSLPTGSTKTEERTDEDEFLQRPTDASEMRTDRSGGSGSVSQTELCEELVGKSTKHRFVTELGVPVAIKGDEFFAYDDARSVQTKTIWASMHGFGGVAFHAIEMDNADGKCPVGQAFSLLRKIATTQTCRQCVEQNAPTEGSKTCESDGFSVLCSYRLPEQNEPQPLIPSQIPFDKCSEVVVEDALWSADGHLRFRDQQARQHLISLQSLREQNEAANQTRLIAAIKCGMRPEKMEEMLNSDRNLTASILEHLHRYNFDGVELRCDHTLTDKTRQKFLDFALLLKDQLQGYHHHGHCPATMSLRIPVWNNNLTAKYNVQLLNSLHYVVLEPFEVNALHAQLISPLFGLDRSNETHAIDSTLLNWMDAGVEAKKIVLHIPGYGIVQNFTTNLQEVGASVQSNYTMITQSDMCSVFHDSRQHTLYDMVAAYATTSQGQWITYETPSIVTYKVNYAIREHLGGVGLVTVNKDDFNNHCGKGAFPLLNTIRTAICPV